MKYAVTVLLALVLVGCVTEPQKVANDQMGQAATRGYAESDTIVTGMAAPDYVFNLVDMVKRLEALRLYFSDIVKLSSANKAGFGAPVTPIPYKPGDTKKEEEGASKTWYALAGAALMVVAYRAALTYLPSLAGPWGTMATSMIEGFLKGRINSEKAATSIEASKAFLVSMESELVDSGIQGKVKKLAKKAESLLDLKPKVTIR
jgi:hypothetical protein